ncbi:acetyltransferase [Pseudomonas sp. BN411]|uniref:acetyltransferase n=1 Tax=Pseudomonas sp. BN411 TaxID=2567887 RepID=UPI002456F718|nr:acetyltransferase [Pseudomonas sp. BN411]MDH4562759.1 acetyltransferase [Pseudomonas sp. BN411]
MKKAVVGRDEVGARRKMIIYGGGTFAALMRYLFESDSNYVVVAYCLDRKFIASSEIDGLPVVAFEDVENIYSPKDFDMFIAIGYSGMRNRVLMYERAKQKDFMLANYVSSDSVVSDSVVLGENNAILQGVQIEPFVSIGDNNVIWSSVNICHDSKVGNHSFIAAKSTIGGFSAVGNNCFIGFGSTIIHNVSLADETLVGACSLITSDTNKYSKNIGIPAKEIGFHADEGIKIK